MMLDTLRHIVQAVSAATDLDEALAIIVRRVKESMTVDVCSVYLFDTAEAHFVLMATDGLNPASVGKVRLALNEGLVGLVGERQEPVNLKRASDHPSYRYFPETEEERYHGFLGVPLIHFRRMLGVLVIQHREERLFDNDEAAFLVTIAAQLAGALNYATSGGAVSRLLRGWVPTDGFLQGIAGAPGLAIGTVVLPSPFANLASVPDRQAHDIEGEEAAFTAAVTVVQEELRASGNRMATMLPAEAQGLFDVYAMFLDNDWLFADTVKRIRAGQWAPGAWRDTIVEHAQVFEQMEDPYLRARAEDIRAIGRRILLRLRNGAEQPKQYPERCVLLGEEVSVARMADMPVHRLAGVVSLRSSALSHTAILARALGIPAVMGLGELPVGRLEGATVVVDGYQGRVFIHPSHAVLAEFRQLIQEERKLSAGLGKLRNLPSETPDGARLPLYANIGLLSEIVPTLNAGAEGIGLYRTEFPFILRESFPGEDEQYRLYRQVLESLAPRPVTMRTLDVGGDKALPYLPVPGETNPYLGWRGIRITLDHPEIFRTQLRAMLRANSGLGNLHVLFPMISRVNELDEALNLLERLYQELCDEGEAVARPPVGAMIEVPSAVYLAGNLAERVDFVSIGTNDLTQYLLAVDRNNPRVAGLYDSLHPAVVNAVREIVDKAHQRGKPVSLCGEMAGDPAAALLLLGMGVDSLSMSFASLPRVKWMIRTFTREYARRLLDEALALESDTAVRRLLNGALEQAGLGGLVRVGRGG